MRSWFDKLTIGLVIVLSVPTSLAILTWRSLPGHIDYPIKLAMERLLLLVVSPSYAASGNLRVAITERRVAEAEKLLADQGSTAGLVYLANQVSETKTTILAGSNRQTQQELSVRYVETLKDSKAKLEVQKQTIIQTSSEQPERTRTQASPTQKPQVSQSTLTKQPVLPTAAPSPPQPPPAEIIDEIEETQDLIQDSIDDLQNVAESSGYSQDEGRGQSEEHRQDDDQGRRDEDNARGNDDRGRGNEDKEKDKD